MKNIFTVLLFLFILVSVSSSQTLRYYLYQNEPEPFYDSTSIKFDLLKATNVNLWVTDSIGNTIATLRENTYCSAGTYKSVWLPSTTLPEGTYFCKMTADTFSSTITMHRKATATSVFDQSPINISQYVLYQNYPNPFNPATVIRYSLPVNGSVTLKVYDVIGREVAMLMNQEKLAGTYQIPFDASKLPSGIYFYRLTAGSFTQVKKMLMIK
jgi:hypothetical protein